MAKKARRYDKKKKVKLAALLQKLSAKVKEQYGLCIKAESESNLHRFHLGEAAIKLKSKCDRNFLITLEEFQPGLDRDSSKSHVLGSYFKRNQDPTSFYCFF